MVVNISKVLSNDWAYVADDIRAVIDVAHSAQRKVKVIFENCYLQEMHKIKLCEICSELKADWVKTSTGYGSGGATMDDLKLMLQHVAPGVQVKAAGGIRDLATLLQARELGVTRVGASRTAEMLGEARTTLGLPSIQVAGSVAPSDTKAGFYSAGRETSGSRFAKYAIAIIAAGRKPSGSRFC